MWDELLMYLQLVKMVKIQFPDLLDLLPQIQEFQENYAQILANGHSKLSEDLSTCIFSSCSPDSYQDTAQQYHDNIMSIANYNLQDINHWVMQNPPPTLYQIQAEY